MSSPTVPEQSDFVWFLRGARGIFSAPAIILMLTLVGYGGLAREAGLSLGETLMGLALVWALPSLLVMVSGILSGASLLVCMIAVALSAVRLLPMTIAFVPLVRDPDRPRWQVFFASHFVAVTAWVFAQTRLPALPRPVRTPYFLGFAMTLVAICLVMVAIAYVMLDAFPPIVAGALFFMTPVYFLTALWATARFSVDRIAMLAGLVLGPIFHVLEPDFDVLWAGLVGGTISYLGVFLAQRWAARP